MGGNGGGADLCALHRVEGVCEIQRKKAGLVVAPQSGEDSVVKGLIACSKANAVLPGAKPPAQPPSGDASH